MTDQSQMSTQKTLKNLTSATSLLESEGGPTLSNSPGGIQTDLFGLEVAPVKVSQPLDNVKAQMMSVTSGLRGSGSSESRSLQQSLASKLLEQSVSDGSMQSQQILKRVTTDSLRAYCQDTLSEPITVDRDSGSWPTPRTVDGTGGAARLNEKGKRQSDTTGIEYGATLRDSVHTLTGEQSSGLDVKTTKRARFRLNPKFSLWLMGYPKSWINKAIPENTVTRAR